MATGQAAIARATAAVFVHGRRVGSAVLVADRYLVTAAHVLPRGGRAADATPPRGEPTADATAPVTPATATLATAAPTPAALVAVEFPGLGSGGPGGRLPASHLDLGAAGAGVDVAVLDLGEDRPAGLPAPVPLWPAGRPPGRVRVFGYPLAEPRLNGVWRLFDVAGPAAYGSVQLDWADDAGSFPGHSGGPVVDADQGALAGILVEGAERGRFDRYLPVALIAAAWPLLPRPWLVTGADRGEARSHFTRRSRGQRNTARGGDLFRGRQAALGRIGEWLASEEAPGLPLVVTGQPGAGKSAVLARAALGAEDARAGPGLAFHARAASIADFLGAVADFAWVDHPATVDDLVADLAERPESPPIPVAVDALDEAASERDRRQIAEALTELAVLPGFRVAVATRPLAGVNPYAPGGLLPALGVTDSDADNLVHLDSDAYFDAESLRQFAAALLAQDGMDRPGPPGAAWAQYRDRPAACDRMAAVIAERAGRNFLVAAMASAPLSAARGVTDPAASGFDRAGIPSGVGEALAKYLEQLPEQRREHDRALLTALAYARGTGLDDPAWLAFTAALGYPATMADLDSLRRSAAADYLLQTRTERGARPLTRLFHQALTDELLAERDRPGAERLLLDLVIGQGTRSGWQDEYARAHAADHASAAGRVDELLDDPLYLVRVEPARLVPYLDTARSADAKAVATVYRQTAHHLTALDQPMRASQLELAAHQLGYRGLAERVAAAVPGRPWRVRWSQGHRAASQQVLTGHKRDVRAVALGALPDGTPVAVTGSADKTVRVWRLTDGAAVGQPLRGHDGNVDAVAVGALPDGTPVIVSGDDGQVVRIWRLADGTPLGPPRGRPAGVEAGGIEAVGVVTLGDGPPAVVSGYSDGTARVWPLLDGSPDEPVFNYDDVGQLRAVGTLPDGTPVAVSSGSGLVCVWRLGDGTQVGEIVPFDCDFVWGATVGVLPDRTPVAVTGGSDGTVRVWRLADGSQVGEPLRGHNSSVWAVATGALADGSPVIVSGGADGIVRVWRLGDGTPVGEPLRGHDGMVNTVAAGTLPDGTPVIVSGGGDGTVRIWRLADSIPDSEPLRGHDGQVHAVATATLPDGTPVAVSGGFDDGTVRVWRLADGTPMGEPLRGPADGVHAIAIWMQPDGTPVAIAGGSDGTARAWRVPDGVPVGEFVCLHDGDPISSVAVGRLADGSLAVVSGGLDHEEIRVWRLPDGTPAGVSIALEGTGTRAVTVGALPDGAPVAVTVSGHRYGSGSIVRVWRLADGTPVGGPVSLHDGKIPTIVDNVLYLGRVHAVATGVLSNGTPVAVTGGDERVVRIWRLADGTTVRKLLPAHEGEVLAVTVGTLPDGSMVVVSGGEDGSVRMWRLADGALLVPPLAMSRSVEGVAVHGDVIVTAAGGCLAALQPALTARDTYRA